MKINCNKTFSGLFYVVIAFIWVIGCVLFLKYDNTSLTNYYIEKKYFNSVIKKEKKRYLYNLRDSHLGCRTLLYQDPDIIFFGDSHAYAGWDYLLLDKSLTDKKIASCAIAGLHPNSIVEFLSFINKTKLKPKHLIVSISLSNFLYDPQKDIRITQTNDLLNEIQSPQENLLNLFAIKWRKIPNFIKNDKITENKVIELSRKIADFNSFKIDALLQKHDIFETTFWKEKRDRQPNKQLPQIIKQIYKKSKQSNIELTFVYIPESKWLLKNYTKSQKKHFEKMLNLLSDYGFRVLAKDYYSGGLENKYFINRNLLQDYPYNAWGSKEEIDKWVIDQKGQHKWKLFDPDHLNAAGATYFTSRILPKLKKIIN